jgi:AcrR family transcriptional regulator
MPPTIGQATARLADVTDDTRARILRVALELFESRGYHATSVREIAEKVGLTKAAVLYHFPSKKDIVAALVEPMLTEMEAVLVAANGTDPRRGRWAAIEGLLDVWLTHRYLLRMGMQDLTHDPVFERFREAAVRASDVVAGPGADLADRIRGVQAVAMLTDPVAMFAETDTDDLRAMVLAGVQRLLNDAPPARTRRRGRPGAMSPDMVEAARRLHAGGEHTAAEIAQALGVSRATVYRHLS